LIPSAKNWRKSRYVLHECQAKKISFVVYQRGNM
jgi:hypothetical protein